MQIVFMNRMSGADESGHLRSAQVWIGEEEGGWRLGWRNMEPDGEVSDDEWYEGSSWNELLCVYRHQLAKKLGEGFRPLIEGYSMNRGDREQESRHSEAAVLQRAVWLGGAVYGAVRLAQEKGRIRKKSALFHCQQPGAALDQRLRSPE